MLIDNLVRVFDTNLCKTLFNHLLGSCNQLTSCFRTEQDVENFVICTQIKSSFLYSVVVFFLYKVWEMPQQNADSNLTNKKNHDNILLNICYMVVYQTITLLPWKPSVITVLPAPDRRFFIYLTAHYISNWNSVPILFVYYWFCVSSLLYLFSFDGLSIALYDNLVK